MAHSLPAAELTRGECCALLGCRRHSCALLQALGSGLARACSLGRWGVCDPALCSWLLPTGASSVSPLGMEFFLVFFCFLNPCLRMGLCALWDTCCPPVPVTLHAAGSLQAVLCNGCGCLFFSILQPLLVVRGSAVQAVEEVHTAFTLVLKQRCVCPCPSPRQGCSG